MPRDLLKRLEEWKARIGTRDAAGLERLLETAMAHRFTDAESLIRLHECALFLCAYPQSPRVRRLADAILFSFGQRVAGGAAAFEDPKISGIAGTSLSAVFSYEVARRLAARYPAHIEIDWDNYDRPEKLGPVLRRFVPLVAEDWPVEAHVPYRCWIAAARRPGGSDLGWLLEQFEHLPIGERDKADLYESMNLLLAWRIGNARTSRSRLRLPGKIFYHTEPLLRRGNVSLEREMEEPPPAIRSVSRAEARAILDLILDTSAMRYRELYGFTHPDYGRVFKADVGRGVEIYVFGVPPEWRLPLRAYHGGMFFKNGVPAGYVEVLSIFEHAEVGFNLYYTFREGESAWIYARLLRLFRQMLGVKCFSVDPYQIGFENDEALDSGAFWFYRKLGFRPVDPEVARVVELEEAKMRRDPGYRSSRRILEKLARSYIVFECADAERGAWERFTIRAVGLKCTEMHAEAALPWMAARWPDEDRAAVEAIVRAKTGPDESRYLHLMQRQARLRRAVLELGLTGARCPREIGYGKNRYPTP
jgi:hypothetical protein